MVELSVITPKMWLACTSLSGLFSFTTGATDEVHDHSYCPSGEDSWCKYSSASAKNLPPPRIPVDLAPFVKPVFEDLSKPQLLEKCIDGATQNQNESFNNILWSRCPKTGFCSLVTVEAALGLAILTFLIMGLLSSHHCWRSCWVLIQLPSLPNTFRITGF